jgi:hypothetical protein
VASSKCFAGPANTPYARALIAAGSDTQSWLVILPWLPLLEQLRRATELGQTKRHTSSFPRMETESISAVNGREECMICLEHIIVPDIFIVCRHAYHRRCLETWQRTGKDTCPTCRGTIHLMPASDPSEVQPVDPFSPLPSHGRPTDSWWRDDDAFAPAGSLNYSSPATYMRIDVAAAAEAAQRLRTETEQSLSQARKMWRYIV